MVPNTTHSIDIIHMNTDAISDSIVNGNNSNTLAVIPTDNLTRSYPFLPKIIYSPVSPSSISQMRFYITDTLERPINLNEIDWYITLILRSSPI